MEIFGEVFAMHPNVCLIQVPTPAYPVAASPGHGSCMHSLTPKVLDICGNVAIE